MVNLKQRRIDKCCVKSKLGFSRISFSCNRLIVTGKLFTGSFLQDGEYDVLTCPRQCFSSALQMVECIRSKYSVLPGKYTIERKGDSLLLTCTI